MKSSTTSSPSSRTHITGPHRDQMYLLDIWLKSKNVEHFSHLLEQDPRAMAATKRVRQHLERKRREAEKDPESAEWMRSNPALAKVVVGKDWTEYAETETATVKRHSKPESTSSEVKVAVVAAAFAALGAVGFFGTKAYFEYKYSQSDAAEAKKTQESARETSSAPSEK